VVLIADDDVELPVHRAVLAACSHYFYAMFTSELSESRSDRVTLKQIDSQALELLVSYMYTSEIRIVEDNVQVGIDMINNVQVVVDMIDNVQLGSSVRHWLHSLLLQSPLLTKCSSFYLLKGS